MNWKEILRKLEKRKQWDAAIEFMQEVIRMNPYDMDAYIAINYFFMNLITEEDYNTGKQDYYIELAHKYLDEPYEKFSDNPEYLFFTGITSKISEWFLDIKADDITRMLNKALTLDPDNLLYLWGNYSCLNARDLENINLMASCAQKVIKDFAIVAFLKSKGAVGEYLLEIQLKPVSKKIEDFV